MLSSLRLGWLVITLPVYLFFVGLPDPDDVLYMLTPEATPPASAADATCAKLWIDGARNDPWLRCYLVSMNKRLCRAEEREHLTWVLRHYEAERKVFDRKLWQYLLLARRDLKDAAKAPGEPLANHQKALGNAASKSLEDKSFAKALSLESIADSDLREMLRDLVKQGLARRDDLRGGMPEWVADAFADTPVKPVCLA